MRSSIIPTVFATVAVVLAVGSDASVQDQGLMRRHHSKVARDANIAQLQKRSFSGLATFYGMSSGDQGACGNMLNENDFTVALNEVQYGNLNSQSSYCDKTITITNGEKTTTAKITDACPTTSQCHFGALDMSKSLFTFFNPTSVGVFDITWWINGEGSSSSSTTSSASSDSSNNDSNTSSDTSSSSNSSDDAAAKKAAAAKAAAAQQAKEDAAKKAAAEKKKEAAAAKAKAAKEQAAKKAAAEKKKEAEQKKQAQQAKVESAQKENIAAFGEIMEALNNMVEDAMDQKST